MPLPTNARLDTKLLHAGQEPDPSTGARAVPIYQTTAFNFRDTEHAENLFGLKEAGNIYSRLTNPTNDVFEKRMAELEGGIAALSFSSGHAAIAGAICNLAQVGDNIVSSSTLYGGTYNMFSYTLPRMGISVIFSQTNKPEDYRKLINDNTKALYIETIGNPRAEIPDIEGIAKVAHENGIPLIVDATFSPYINRSIEFGGDIVVHSTTKFIGGHGTSMGGAVIDAGKFNYGNGKFPILSEPDPSYHGLKYTDLGSAAFITRLRTQIMRDLGACLSPFNSFMFLQGLETLHLRMERHCQNAQKAAEFLESHPQVAWVSYPGLKSSPDYELAKKYFPKGPGAIFAFGIKGGREAGRKFIDNVQLLSHLANVGDAKSLVIHPASTTHSQLTPEQMKLTGTTEDLIRLSIGIEDINDIIEDLEHGLKKSM